MSDKKNITFKDLFSCHLKYFDYVASKSIIAHQYTKNISLSGSEVESEIRDIFQQIIPKRFRVTHGYIIAADNKNEEPKISGQVDMMIVDTLVGNAVFQMDGQNGVEIVPKEAVVGIFEIKRTLTKKALTEAIEHLNDNILKRLDISKSDKDRYLPGGVKIGVGLNYESYSNPIVGVIGLKHSAKCESFLKEQEKNNDKMGLLDFVCSLGGLFFAHVEDNLPKNYKHVHCREKDVTYKYLLSDQSKGSQDAILSKVYGYILSYLFNANGRNINADNYFFNRHAFK